MMAIAAISPGAAPVRRRAFVAEAMCPRRKEPRGGLHERRSAGGAGRRLVFSIDARSRRPEPVCNGAGTTIFRRRPEFLPIALSAMRRCGGAALQREAK